MPNRNINSLTMRMECESRSSLSYVKKSTGIHLNVGLLSLLPPTIHFEQLVSRRCISPVGGHTYFFIILIFYYIYLVCRAWGMCMLQHASGQLVREQLAGVCSLLLLRGL